MSAVKQVIVMRNDLGMRKGKMIAQGAHASIAFLTRRLKRACSTNIPGLPDGYTERQRVATLLDPEIAWIEGSFAKVCVKVGSEEELLEIFQKAKDAGLETHLITDSGLTEFHGEPTNTCVGIGPDLSEKIDPITGHLTLL